MLATQAPGFVFFLKAYWLQRIWQSGQIRLLPVRCVLAGCVFGRKLNLAPLAWRERPPFRLYARRTTHDAYIVIAFHFSGCRRRGGPTGLYSVSERRPRRICSGRCLRQNCKARRIPRQSRSAGFLGHVVYGIKKGDPLVFGIPENVGPKGFAVVGVSMDQEGWKALRPFLAEHRYPTECCWGTRQHPSDMESKAFLTHSLSIARAR